MCLLVNVRFPYRYTTIQPMTVYKIIDIYNASLIRHFQYTKHTGYALDRELMIDPDESVAEGFHAYISVPNTIIGGYSKIVKFVIPAGAHLFVGENDDVVSDVVSDRIESGSLRGLIFGSVMHTSVERWLKAATGLRLSTLSSRIEPIGDAR